MVCILIPYLMIPVFLKSFKRRKAFLNTKASLPVTQNKINQLETLIKRKVTTSTYNTKVSQVDYNINSKANTRDVDIKLRKKADYSEIDVLDGKVNNFTYTVSTQAYNIPHM